MEKVGELDAEKMKTEKAFHDFLPTSVVRDMKRRKVKRFVVAQLSSAHHSRLARFLCWQNSSTASQSSMERSSASLLSSRTAPPARFDLSLVMAWPPGHYYHYYHLTAELHKAPELRFTQLQWVEQLLLITPINLSLDPHSFPLLPTAPDQQLFCGSNTLLSTTNSSTTISSSLSAN